jgi:hypothetical protein
MGARGPQPTPIEHGTQLGYQKHIKRQEEACTPCKEAHAADQRQYKNSDKPGAVRDRARQRAIARSYVRLRNLFPIEFEAIYQDEKKKEPELNGQG